MKAFTRNRVAKGTEIGGTARGVEVVAEIATK